MIKKYFNRLIACLGLITAILFLASCEKDSDEVGSGQVELISFGPTGAKHGDTLRFFGNNLNRVTSIQLTGAAIDKANFISQTASEIFIIIPASAVKGLVMLKADGADITSKTQLNLGVTPVVSSMTMQARPGSDITINGNFLNWVTSVTFADGKVVTSFVSQAIDKLVITVPADAQTGPLVFNYSGTTAANMQTADTLKVALPVITTMSPNPVKHADNLTITGTNLDLAKQILFTGVTAPVTSFVSQTATQIIVKVPGTAKKGKITLVPLSGVPSVSSADLDISLPAVTSFAPSPVDPGANLTVNGTNLNLVTSITFENTAAVTTFVSQSATQIVVKVPMGVARGRITLGILNSSLTVLSTDILEVTGAAPPPVIAYPFYSDAVTSNWNGWVGGGWGGTSNYGNTSPVREGTKSVAINYVGGYGSPVQLGGGSVALGAYSSFKVSVFGAPGSGGKRMTIGINGVNGAGIITIVEGAWTDYSFPISTLTSAATLTEIWVQEYSGTGGFTVYVDAMGLN